MTIATALTALDTQRKNLAANLTTQGVASAGTETLAQLVPKVLNIKGGGGGETTTGDYLVRYIDYDGTILKSQWVDSGEDATPPSAPSHDNLTFQEWSNSSTNITQDKTIGATYITADGKTHFNIRTTVVGGKALVLYLNKSDASTLTVDWGDGTSSTFTNSGNFDTGTHTYPDYGDYTIKMWISSGTGTYGFGHVSSSSTVVGGSVQNQRNMLISCFVGSNVTSIGNYAFYYCRSLSSITIPDGVTSIGNDAFRGCSPLSSITIPDGVTSIGNYAFYYCRSLSSITIPDGVTSIGSNAFYYCSPLSSITIPDGVTSIGNYAFCNCYSLSSITIPDGVTSIGSNAFYNCLSMSQYVFLSTTPPILVATNAFSSILSSTKIYVPDASVDAYKAATNWAIYGDYIYPISEMEV
jgi:hypothetical protein